MSPGYEFGLANEGFNEWRLRVALAPRPASPHSTAGGLTSDYDREVSMTFKIGELLEEREGFVFVVSDIGPRGALFGVEIRDPRGQYLLDEEGRPREFTKRTHAYIWLDGFLAGKKAVLKARSGPTGLVQ